MDDNWWVRMHVDREKRAELIRQAEQERLAEKCKKQEREGRTGWLTSLFKITDS